MVNPSVIEVLTQDGKLRKINIERVEPFGSKTVEVVLNPVVPTSSESASFQSNYGSDKDSDDDDEFNYETEYFSSYPSQCKEMDPQHNPDRFSPSNLPSIPFLQQLPPPTGRPLILSLFMPQPFFFK